MPSSFFVKTELALSTFFTCSLKDSPSSLERWGNTCLLPFRKTVTFGGRKVTLYESTYKISPKGEKSNITGMLSDLLNSTSIQQEGWGGIIIALILFIFILVMSVPIGISFKAMGLLLNAEARRRNWKLVELRYQEQLMYREPIHKATLVEQIEKGEKKIDALAPISHLPTEMMTEIAKRLDTKARGRIQQVSRTWFLVCNDSWRLLTREEKEKKIKKYFPEEIIAKIGLESLLQIPRMKLRAHRASDQPSDYSIQPLGSRRVEGKLMDFKMLNHHYTLLEEPQVVRDSLPDRKMKNFSIYLGFEPIPFIVIPVIFRKNLFLKPLWSKLKENGWVRSEYSEQWGFVVLHPLKVTDDRSYWGLSRSWSPFADIISMNRDQPIENYLGETSDHKFTLNRKETLDSFLSLWKGERVGKKAGLQGKMYMDDEVTPTIELLKL